MVFALRTSGSSSATSESATWTSRAAAGSRTLVIAVGSRAEEVEDRLSASRAVARAAAVGHGRQAPVRRGVPRETSLRPAAGRST